MPDELRDFELMLATGWTWHELMATPMYVRRFTWDLLCTRREAEANANEKAAG